MAGYAAPPVPGYVAPVTQTPVAEYIDDTRGVFLPPHNQLRAKTEPELRMMSPEAGPQLPRVPNAATREEVLNQLADGYSDRGSELERIGSDNGLLTDGTQMAQNASVNGATAYPQARRTQPQALEDYPSLATGGSAKDMVSGAMKPAGGGEEIAVGGQTGQAALDIQNSIVRLKEERISVRRALQRMLDQVGGAGWTTVWDLDEVNAGLPDMEISIYAEEPFSKVLNALLARLQTRSGQPLRVVKYDQTQRLVITDRASGSNGTGIGPGAGEAKDVAVTQTMLKESTVSMHYDEIPLVDALENIVSQAGRGQWRLRMYAGSDQVLKPAHIEEPFGVAIERVLKLFNLRYEIFPGGKLIVVTAGDSFGFRGVQ